MMLFLCAICVIASKNIKGYFIMQQLVWRKQEVFIKSKNCKKITINLSVYLVLKYSCFLFIHLLSTASYACLDLVSGNLERFYIMLMCFSQSNSYWFPLVFLTKLSSSSFNGQSIASFFTLFLFVEFLLINVSMSDLKDITKSFT